MSNDNSGETYIPFESIKPEVFDDFRMNQLEKELRDTDPDPSCVPWGKEMYDHLMELGKL